MKGVLWAGTKSTVGCSVMNRITNMDGCGKVDSAQDWNNRRWDGREEDYVAWTGAGLEVRHQAITSYFDSNNPRFSRDCPPNSSGLLSDKKEQLHFLQSSRTNP